MSINHCIAKSNKYNDNLCSSGCAIRLCSADIENSNSFNELQMVLVSTKTLCGMLAFVFRIATSWRMLSALVKM